MAFPLKKLLSLALALSMCLTCAFALAETAPAEPVSITIFHTNDTHARYDNSVGMGYAMMATFVNAARNAGDNVLVLDAGDTFHGTVFANTVKGESIAAVMNAIGYNAMAAGNHDFNYGYDRLMELAEVLQFPILSCNILKEDGSFAFKPYEIIEIAGKKIAIVGAQNPQIQTAIHPDRIAGLVFTDEAQVAKVVSEVKDQADAVIVLTHWGADDAYDPNSSALAAIEGVDLVIDGHSHTLLADIKQVEGNALVVSNGEYLQQLGVVKMTFAEDGLKLEAMSIPNPGVFEDHGVLKAVFAAEDAQSAALDTVIGKATVELEGRREICRTQESNWGDIVCDIFLKTTGADIAFVNGGGIRASVPAGDITIRDINTVYPFGNYVVVIQVTGKVLLEALEHGFSNLPETSGGFPQIGGMRVVVDASKEPGSRVTELTIGSVPVDEEMIYTMVTNDYLAAGGDSYAMLATCPMLLEMAFMDEVLVNYIQEVGEIGQEIDGRITILN